MIALPRDVSVVRFGCVPASCFFFRACLHFAMLFFMSNGYIPSLCFFHEPWLYSSAVFLLGDMVVLITFVSVYPV